jgi:hypothetical protein
MGAVVAAFTAAEAADFTQGAEALAAAFVADPLQRRARERGFHAPRQACPCAPEVGRMSDPAVVEIDPSAAQ